MKLHPEDPRITSYLLGELPERDAALVAAAIEEDPALQAACAEFHATREPLESILAGPPRRLDSSARDIILAAARDADKAASPRCARWRTFLPPLAAAAAVALVAALTWNSLRDRPAPVTASPDDPASVPAEESSTDPAPLPAIASAGGFRTPAKDPALTLPVIGRHSALPAIARAVREEHRMPDPADTRVASLLNSYPLRPAGPTIVARFPVNHWHPDNRTPSVTTHAATVATETLPCPWSPSSVLVLVSLGGNPRVDCDMEASFRPQSANVRRYRLLETPVPDADRAPAASSRLRAGETSLLAIEIEPHNPQEPLGEIVWSVNGRPANPVPVSFDRSHEPSDDARFAALLCSFAFWAAGDPEHRVDADLVAAIAREVAAENLPPDRADFLILVDQALNL